MWSGKSCAQDARVAKVEAKPRGVDHRMLEDPKSLLKPTSVAALLQVAGDAAHGELQPSLGGLAHGLLAGGLALATAAHGCLSVDDRRIGSRKEVTSWARAWLL